MAVILVTGFHLWPSALPGGYLGVDMFFAISGYLLTQQLATELETTGRIGVVAFWARRARRLLPSALVVLASTTIATYVVVPQPFWHQFCGEIVASTLYVQNWVLAFNSVDYFAANNESSPVQHFWTLSVEEQFYGVLPLLMVAVWGVTRHRIPELRRRALVAVVAMLTCSSLLMSYSLCGEAEAFRYFSTFARAWEFGAGALLSLVAVKVNRPVWRFGLRYGLTALVAALFVDIHGGPFHALGAELLAVFGTICVLLAGSDGDQGAVFRLLSIRPLQSLGALSYGVYLWHWPIIAITPIALARGIASFDKGAIAVSSIALAWATYKWVEAPIRFSSRPVAARRVWTFSALGSASVLVLASAGFIALDALAARSSEIAQQMVDEFPGCFGAGTMTGSTGCARHPPANMLVPDPAVAAKDNGNRKECWATSGQTELRRCSLGPQTNYRKRVAAIGDSHNNALLPAYSIIADEEQWRIDVAGKIGCYWTVAVQAQRSPALVDECEAWKGNLNTMLREELPYDAIIVTHGASRTQPVPASGETQSEVIVRGLLAAWETQRRRGTRIIAIRDNPIARRDTVDCVARHRVSADEFCSLDRAQAFAAFDGNVRATELLPDTRLIDLSRYYCDETTCLTLIGNVVVYRDADHITATFARTLAPFLGAELRRALEN